MFGSAMESHKRIESYKDIETASDQAILAFIDGLANNPQNYLTHWESWEYYKDNHLKDSQISECCCQDGSHNRFSSGNSRAPTEQAIIDKVLKISQSEAAAIKLLSLGAGSYLQDLIILCRLVFLKIKSKNIQLVCVEPRAVPNYPTEQEIKQSDSRYMNKGYSKVIISGRRERELINIIEKINKATGFNIQVEFYKSIDGLPKNCSFDGVYAIDYDSLRLGGNHSTQCHHEIIEDDPYYDALIALMKSLTLLKKDRNAFAAFSIHEQVNWFTGYDLSPSSQSLPCLSTNNIFDSYAFNASLAPFLYYLPFFINEKKPLVFNEVIVNPQDKTLLIAVLEQFQLGYSFYNKDTLFKNEEMTFVVETRFVKSPCLVPFKQNFSVLRYNDEDKKFQTFPCHIKVQVESLTTTHLKPLLEKPCPINRSDNYFFEEFLSLADYLKDLAGKSEEDVKKAQQIIYYLKEGRLDLVDQELAVHKNKFDFGATTGTKIWNSLVKDSLVRGGPLQPQ